MSIIAFIIILFAFCGCYASYAKYHSALHPIFLYNLMDGHLIVSHPGGGIIIK